MAKLTQTDIAMVFGLAPKAAIAYLENKGFKLSFNWEEVLDQAHHQAFTVAKVMQMDILQDIHQGLTGHLNSGGTRRDFIKKMTPLLQAKGWWGQQTVTHGGSQHKVQLGSQRRLKLIFHNNIHSAYASGRYRAMKQAVVTHPYWQYVSIMSLTSRAKHKALHLTTLRHDDPAWQYIYPLNGHNCKCRVRPIAARRVERGEIKVQKSQVEMRDVEIGISRKTGEIRTGSEPKVVQVADVKVINNNGVETIFSPDVGFNASPGTPWKPDLSRYPAPLVAQYQLLLNSYLAGKDKMDEQ